MKERRWGRIVTITSLTVKQPNETLILSNTYRTGLTAFMKTLAGEVAPFGITVNCVCPGFTETERLAELAQNLAAKRHVTVAQVREDWIKAIPAGRLGKPERDRGPHHLPGLGAGGLHHRRLRPGGRRAHQGAGLSRRESGSA